VNKHFVDYLAAIEVSNAQRKLHPSNPLEDFSLLKNDIEMIDSFHHYEGSCFHEHRYAYKFLMELLRNEIYLCRFIGYIGNQVLSL